MSTAIFETRNELPATPAIRTVFKRLMSRLPRNGRKPAWAHVTNRAWRRNSALLTYMHEVHTDHQ